MGIAFVRLKMRITFYCRIFSRIIGRHRRVIRRFNGGISDFVARQWVRRLLDGSVHLIREFRLRPHDALNCGATGRLLEYRCRQLDDDVRVEQRRKSLKVGRRRFLCFRFRGFFGTGAEVGALGPDDFGHRSPRRNHRHKRRGFRLGHRHIRIGRIVRSQFLIELDTFGFDALQQCSRSRVDVIDFGRICRLRCFRFCGVFGYRRGLILHRRLWGQVLDDGCIGLGVRYRGRGFRLLRLGKRLVERLREREPERRLGRRPCGFRV